MINYVVIRKNAQNTEKNGTKQIGNNTYGICACLFCDGLLDVKDCVYDVSNDIDWMKALADKLNLYDVDPIHLCDIIEDELYNVKS